jgi:hypothetical protein
MGSASRIRVSLTATMPSFGWSPKGLQRPRGPAVPATMVYGTVGSGSWS